MRGQSDFMNQTPKARRNQDGVFYNRNNSVHANTVLKNPMTSERMYSQTLDYNDRNRMNATHRIPEQDQLHEIQENMHFRTPNQVDRESDEINITGDQINASRVQSELYTKKANQSS